MPLEIKTIEREFNFNGTILPDPNPRLSVAEVQALHGRTFPELTTAKPRVVEKPTANGTKQIITFSISAGTKG